MSSFPPVFVVVAAVLAGGCAARPAVQARAVPVDLAQSLMNAGCYSCLRDALATLEHAARIQPSPALARAAFSSSLLLLVRARELGLPEDEALERARFWGRQIPPRAGQLPPSAYFDAIDLIRGDTSGLPPAEREQRASEHLARWTSDGSVPAARAALSPYVAADLTAEYLALTLDCEDAQARKTFAPEATLARHPVPLIQFRVSVCAADEGGLRRLFDADPRWVDTFYARGRLAMTRQPTPNLVEAAALFADGHAAFPESPAITLALAGARNAIADHAGALSLFDEVLTIQPRHPDALLGRMLSQTYLNRHPDAIRTATVLIELDADHLGLAWYWRAWNRYQLHNLPEAWRDVSHAISLAADASTYALAGVIAYARQWPFTAVDRLAAAYALDSGQCDAVWTEALVHVDQEAFRIAAGRFAVAADCFGRAADQGQREVELAQQVLVRNPSTERQLTLAQERREAAQRRRAQSAFNAANSAARAGDRDAALKYLKIAASHPSMAQKSEELQKQILLLTPLPR